MIGRTAKHPIVPRERKSAFVRIYWTFMLDTVDISIIIPMVFIRRIDKCHDQHSTVRAKGKFTFG